MSDVNLKADGSWAVELMHPVVHDGQTISSVVVHPVRFEQTIKWGRREYPSQLALLAELSQLPERVLRLLQYPDVDRVLIAMTGVLPASIAVDMRDNPVALATPDELLPPMQEDKIVDQGDPRFPHVTEPIKRFPGSGPVFKHQGAQEAQPKVEPRPPVDSSLGDIMKPVASNG